MDKSKELMEIVVRALNDKLAQNVEVLDVNGLTELGDYFVIATGNSTTQVKALADEVEKEAEEAEFSLHHREGYRGQSWILLDFGDVIVHIFDSATREFYSIEHLWKDAKSVDTKEISE